MNEIQEYCLHVTESEAEKDSIQYFIHNTETLYDISYYSNMIDIHVEDECSVSVNTFQLNALLQLLDRLLVASDPAADAVVPEQPNQSSPPDQGTQPVTSKFNIADAEQPLLHLLHARQLRALLPAARLLRSLRWRGQRACQARTARTALAALAVRHSVALCCGGDA